MVMTGTTPNEEIPTARMRSAMIDRTGWSRDRWVHDAVIRYYEPGGGINALISGHLDALFGERRDVNAKIEDLRDILAGYQEQIARG